VRNLSGFITPEGSAPRSAKGALVGPVSHWIESLTRAVTELGVDGVVFWPMQEQEQQIAEFAELVLPDVRAAWESR
jgi:hypothetical protein